MGNIKDVKVTISGVTMNGETYFKLLRLIKKHEPEIWDEIKDTVVDSLESAMAKADASENGLDIQRVSASLLEESWNFVQDFKKSKEYDRLINVRGAMPESVIMAAGAVYDFICNAR